MAVIYCLRQKENIMSTRLVDLDKYYPNMPLDEFLDQFQLKAFEEFYYPREFAYICGVKTSTVNTWLRRGKIAAAIRIILPNSRGYAWVIPKGTPKPETRRSGRPRKAERSEE